MSRRGATTVLALLVTMTFSLHLLATTWAPVDVVCPVCKTKNKFQAVMSFGGYIYWWPSKFQMIFWPFTDSNVLYSCKQCHYTAFMGDFEDVPAEKVEALRVALSTVELEQNEDYARIPMTQRLAVADKVYSVLESEDAFWCHFHRVVGYHAENEGKDNEAAAARRKALELAQKMLAQPESEGRRKELLLIAASMHHFLKEDEKALTLLREAAASKMQDPQLSSEQNENANKYLSDLIKEYTDKLEKGEPIPDSKPAQ